MKASNLCDENYTAKSYYDFSSGGLYLKCMESATEQDNYIYFYKENKLYLIRSSDVLKNGYKFFSSGTFGSYPICKNQKTIKSDLVSITKVPQDNNETPYCYNVHDVAQDKEECNLDECLGIYDYLKKVDLVSLDFQSLKYIEKNIIKPLEINYDTNDLIGFFNRIGYNKKYISSINNIAYFLQLKNKDNDAVQIFKKILDKYPDRVVTYLNLADSQWKLDDKKSAKLNYAMYIKLMISDGKENKIPEVVKERVK